MKPFFLPMEGKPNDHRFCQFYPPNAGTDSPVRGLVVYVHPFAEEMNKSRRMAALQARALAHAGFAVLQMDLQGCGDSTGDFGDATWQTWVNDVVIAGQWLLNQYPPAHRPEGRMPLWLWGLRAGCLLAHEAAQHLSAPCNFLFWQAPASGKTLFQQFLRLKLAADLAGGQTKGLMQALRDQLTQGTAIEVAGYTVHPALAHGFEQAAIAPPTHTPYAQRIEWFDLSTRDDAELSPAAARTIDALRQAHVAVTSHVVRGPAFWQTTEIETAPDLVTQTTAVLLAATDPLNAVRRALP